MGLEVIYGDLKILVIHINPSKIYNLQKNGQIINNINLLFKK